MKRLNKILLGIILLPTFLVGCNDLLDVDSDKIVTADEYTLTASNDTLFSMFAVFSKLSKLSDNYVLLGELRGDLMDVSSKSDLYMKQISNFDISTDNPYTQIKDYYAIINNCNYIIHRIDTTVVKNSEKVLLKEYAACKAIRAWTYMQIAINYGSAIYYDMPILSVQDAEKVQAQTPLTLDELAPVLISDIDQYKDVNVPMLGSLYGYNTSRSYFPIRFILGDLYLWTGEYEKAAQAYYDLINTESYLISSNSFLTAWTTIYNSTTLTWSYVPNGITVTGRGYYGIFAPQSYEQVSNIAATNQYGQYFKLDSLTSNRTLIPTDVALKNWDSQTYYSTATLYKTGDFRKYAAVSSSNSYLTSTDMADTASTKEYYIYKYLLLNPASDTYQVEKMVSVYRVATLYLRYAEALNRLGKPNTAFAVLKYGLNSTNLKNTSMIPHKELNIGTIKQTVYTSSLNTDSIVYDTTFVVPSYMNFESSKFDLNIGIRARTLGDGKADIPFYLIPHLATQEDSILYVEDKIQQELALETAFEGNRFHDLMRIAIRRNDNAYLANIVAKKHTTNKEAIRSKLMDRANWYIPKK